MKRIGPQGLAAAAILVVLAVVAVVTAPPQRPPMNTFASTSYSADGYRAWAAVLGREGIGTTRFVLRPIELTARIDTLISAQPPAEAADGDARTAADLGALAAWVRRGGRLVYAGRYPGLASAEETLLNLPVVLPDIGPRGALRGPWAAEVRRLHGLGTNRTLLLEHAGRALLSDGNGDIVVRYPLGRGSVTAVVDPAPLENMNLAADDNARLAFLLARPQHPGGVVAFDDGVHGALIDRPWYRALPIPVRVGLAIGAIALLLALIGSAFPGPAPMPLRAAREPSSAEFIDALAALYARISARAAVHTILTRDTLSVAARAAGLPDDAAADVIAARFADRGGADLRALLAQCDVPPATDADLLASARLAYHVRKELTHGGNGDGRRATVAGWTRTGRRR